MGRTYTPRMNDNIFGHWNTHSKTKREKHGYSDIHIHAILAVIHAFTEADRNINRNAN